MAALREGPTYFQNPFLKYTPKEYGKKALRYCTYNVIYRTSPAKEMSFEGLKIFYFQSSSPLGGHHFYIFTGYLQLIKTNRPRPYRTFYTCNFPLRLKTTNNACAVESID